MRSSVSESSYSKGVFISTYGCQMNVNDTERMYSLLEMMGYAPVVSPEKADVIIINSCSVREKPVHKVRSEVGRYKKLKEKNPFLKIGVGGCVAQQEKDRLIKSLPLVDFVFGTDAIDGLPEVLNEVEQKKKKVVSARFEHTKPYQIETLLRNPGVSAFVNITKGCDNFCTFCIVPFTRGRERSRKMSELLEDVERLCKRGVKEVTLLGQNVNSYKSACGSDFADLLENLAEKTSVQRIRYTTSHPKDFNEKLMHVMKEHNSKICEYIHLPAQSGNSEVLERMNRGYTRKEYLEKVAMIRKILPKAVLSTDIIVGFPGETEKQFQDTCTLLDEVEYESIFSFKYSSRPFTKAARFKDQIPEEIKSERLSRLQKKQDEISFRLAKRYLNKTLEVLVEDWNKERGTVSGRSTENKVVHFKGDASLKGKTVPVKIYESFPQTLRGRLETYEEKQMG